MTETSPFELPHLNEIFDALRRGRHLCAADGKRFWSLRENVVEFQFFFIQLGFRLQVVGRVY